MSTTMYLECLTHDPPLSSDEVGQHTYDLADIQKYIANRELLVAMINADIGIDTGNPNWGYTAAWFFYRHRKCEIGICDQYGEKYPTVAPDKGTS